MENSYFAYFAIATFFLFLVATILWVNNSTSEKNIDKEKQKKQNIFGLLDATLANQTEFDLKTIKNLTEAIFRENKNKVSISPILQEYLSKIATGEGSKEKAGKIIKICELIVKENDDHLFDILPTEEKRLLIALKDSFKNNNAISFEYNLKELCCVIRTKDALYIKSDKINKWSFSFGIAGSILTLIFGSIGIIQATGQEKYLKNIANTFITAIKEYNDLLLKEQKSPKKGKY
jgi:hypothetical protein